MHLEARYTARLTIDTLDGVTNTESQALMTVRYALPLLLLGLSALSSSQTRAQRLRDIKTVYVGSFGDGEGPELIRSKIITCLVKSKQFDVLENSAAADAVLTGVSSVAAGVRLLNREQKILWADDPSNRAFSRSVSSSVAERVCQNLLKATAQDYKSEHQKRK